MQLLLFFSLVALVFSDSCPTPNHTPVPGTDRMKTGFDAAGLEFLNLPVFKWNYCDQKTFSPINHSDIVWSVADELFIENEDRTVSRDVVDVCMHFDEAVQTLDWKFSISVGIAISTWGKIAINYSHEAYNFYMEMHQQLTVSAISWLEFEYMTIESLPVFALTLDPIFEVTSGKLPASMGDMKSLNAYIDFMNHWGTHYAYFCKFGGWMHLNMFINDTYFANQSQSWVEDQISLSFHFYSFDINPGFFRNKSDIHIDQDFANHTQVYIFWQGGDPEYQTNTTLQEWKKSIELYPDYINCSMTPIYTLLDNNAVAANYQKLTNFYVTNGCMPTDLNFTPCTPPPPKMDGSRKTRVAQKVH